MCKECGCGRPAAYKIEGQGKKSGKRGSKSAGANPPAGCESEALAGHEHAHPHEHGHEHAGEHSHEHRVVDINQALLEKNDRLAERNRGFFQARGLLVLNMLSSPGSGKTTLLEKTAAMLKRRLRMGVITGDLATDNDAARLRKAGIPVVQITTGTMCHLEAEMIGRALEKLPLERLDLLVIENVGNLVCPAAYDLGEHLRVVLLSVTEGEDKPLKYPPIFHSANVVVVTKTDLAAACGFNRAAAMENLRRISHHAQILELSAKTGRGMEAWRDFLLAEWKRLAPAHRRERARRAISSTGHNRPMPS
jgi:hydrogenase nickel incorporation protein HypB